MANQGITKRQADGQRTRTIKRLMWQVRWFKGLSFARFQQLLRKSQLFDELVNRIEVYERERAISNISMGEAYTGLRKDIVELVSREGSLEYEDEEVDVFYQSFGKTFDFESLDPKKKD